MTLTWLLSIKRSPAVIGLISLMVMLVFSESHADAVTNLTGGTQGIDMSLFVPKAGDWITTSLKNLKDAHVMEWTTKAAQYMIGFFFLMTMFNAWIKRNAGAVLRQLVLSIVALGIIGDISNPSGLLSPAFQAPLNLWKTSYKTSNDMISQPLQNTVVKDTRDLAISAHNFFLNATMGLSAVSTLSTQDATIFANENNGNQKANADLGNSTLKDYKNMAATQTDAMKKASNFFQFGYVFLLSFFMGYAGIIYLSAMVVVLGMILSPIAIAFWASGNGAAMQYIIIGMLASILTVIVTPPILMISATTALHQPTVYLKTMIDTNNTDASKFIAGYRDRTAACGHAEVPITGGDLGGFLPEACTVGINAVPVLQEFGRVTFKVLFGLGMMIITMIISLGIGVNLIQRIPGLIQSALGGGFSGSLASGSGGSLGGGMRSLGNIGSGLARGGMALAGAPGMAMAAGSKAKSALAKGSFATPQATIDNAATMAASAGNAIKAATSGGKAKMAMASEASKARKDAPNIAAQKASAFNSAQQSKANFSAQDRAARLAAIDKGGVMGNTANVPQFNGTQMQDKAASGEKANNDKSMGASSNGGAYSGSNGAGVSKNDTPKVASKDSVPAAYQAKSTTAAEQLKEMKEKGEYGKSAKGDKLKAAHAESKERYGQVAQSLNGQREGLKQQQAGIQQKANGEIKEGEKAIKEGQEKFSKAYNAHPDNQPKNKTA